MLLACAGWSCPRLISVSAVSGGNPVAREDPEGFATRFMTCEDCGHHFCDRCLGRISGQQPEGVHCVRCGGPLSTRYRFRYHEAVSASVPEAIRHYEQALTLVDEGRREEAVRELDRAVLLRPAFAAAYYERGVALRHLDRPAEAVTAFEAVLRLDPGNVEARFELGGALRRLGRLPEAAHVYREAARIEPRYTSTLINLGITLNELNRWEEALEVFEEAIRLHAEFRAIGDATGYGASVAQAGKGATLTNLGRYAEALAAIDASISSGPDDPLKCANRAYVLKRLGRLEEARLAAQVAEEIRRRT
ncbi:hypothetical protein C6361_34225 [Plantactinospora sp. BC1]|uniref:tetratricopeptide repeat protein n=1 Tax=Plantactinospora sp. BC1 TaxID=2108470 RepID=UPI000D153E39|nr:tetratricopeptide repeat protein [Plantactinospora sp. BC1]AVT33667.1 hypothetical protein C6361_34225 [Plantactinospora sp. BC1]